MNVFGDYARYYDLLYREKDYGAETSFVLDRLAALGSRPKSVLELGSGTGGHALQLARRGVSVHGVDLSEQMVALARDRAERESLQKTLSFEVADVRTLRASKRFDAVLSLFHVMSYQSSNEDLIAMFKTAREHLAPGGLFIADFWYGPAVLSQLPERRTKVLEGNGLKVHRLCEPELRENENIVEVRYNIEATDLATGRIERTQETHPMRYLFQPELLMIADHAGFKTAEIRGWPSNTPLSLKTWNGYGVWRLMRS